MIQKVLIANRGEIALRIIRTLHKRGIGSIALYTDAEKEDAHVRCATDSFPLGEGTLNETWLNISKIIDIAKESGADAVHPGYGFLSENSQFAQACEDNNIIFLGPQSDVIDLMGSKTTAAHAAAKAGIPLLPRMEGSVQQLIENGASLGFPLLVKAAAGGGGKGMIKVEKPELLEQSVHAASAQGMRYFANDSVYLEKYVSSPRHIEVQIMADMHGNVIHLFERECTLQRNHQKVVEEAPSATLNVDLRKNICDSAVRLAQQVNYRSAGTVEFILDENHNFYFLEMNTRIQVEHPVSEFITGLDLVELQLDVAENKVLSLRQDEITVKGHAIETRLYAEDPAQSFKPSAGQVFKLWFPDVQGLRVESAILGSGQIHPYFDAMMAKIIVFAPDRNQALLKMQDVHNRILVHGPTNNLDLLKAIAYSDELKQNTLSTHTIAEKLHEWAVPKQNIAMKPLLCGLHAYLKYFSGNALTWRMALQEEIECNADKGKYFFRPKGTNGIFIQNTTTSFEIENIFFSSNKHIVSFVHEGKPLQALYSHKNRESFFVLEGMTYKVQNPLQTPLPKEKNQSTEKIQDIKSSLFGRVLKVHVSENQKVEKGEPILVIESMKMENMILAPSNSVVASVKVKEGDQISDGQLLVKFE